MIELKPMSKANVTAALEKAERYRLLNEPWEAESICRDVLAVDPENRDALTVLILAMSDRFTPEAEEDVDEARSLIAQLSSPYDRNYYSGIVCERKGKALLSRTGFEAGPAIYAWLREAMEYYERAEETRTDQADDAILRWNTCARMINQYKHIRPPPGPPSGEWAGQSARRR